MKNFLMQLFVFLPLSAVESVAGAFVIIPIVGFFVPSLDFNAIVAVVLLAVALEVWVGIFFLERKLREFDDEALVQIFFLSMMPLRILFQPIAVILAFIGIFAEGLESDYDYLCEGFWENFFYVLLSCTFSISDYSERSYSGEDHPKTNKIGGHGRRSDPHGLDEAARP